MNKIPNITTVIFDIGGTLININPDVFEKAIREYIPDYNIPDNFSEIDLEAKLDTYRKEVTLKKIIEKYFYKILERLVLDENIRGKVCNELVELALVASKDIWNKPAENILGVLEYLKNKYTLAVISNNVGDAKTQLEKASIATYFKLIVDSKVLGISKPDPRIFLYTAKQLLVNPENCVYIGDVFQWDGIGATNAGMFSILINHSKEYQELVKNNNKIILISSLLEIKKIL